MKMKYNKIWIFGGTGTGKTTFAKKLSEKTKIPFYSTDDFMFKEKWTERYSREEREVAIKKVSNKKSWIIEGVHSTGWPEEGIRKADLILFLKIPLIISFHRILKRERNRREKVGIFSIIKLFWFAIDCNIRSYHYKRHKKHGSEFVVLYGQKKINKFLEKF